MAEKSPAKKKTAPKSTTAAHRNSKAPRTARSAGAKQTVYLTTGTLLQISGKRAGKEDANAQAFNSFEAAKQAAIDALLTSIEDAEELLARLKRAGSLSDIA
ncbi:MAG TPA: hypothetical protein VGJ16_13915 [Pirellulales bacterium]|jgi:hypothetical protein